MLKLLLFSLLVISANCAKAQTAYCDGITKKYDDVLQTTTYRCRGLYGIFVEKAFTPSGIHVFIWFGVTKYTANYEKNSVYVRLSDSSLVSFPPTATCTYQGDGKYDYSGYVELTASQLEIFEKSKIVKFRIAGTDTMVDERWAAKIEEYLNCFEKIKQ